MAYRLSAKRLALGTGPCPQLPGHGGDSELVMTSYHQRITATESCERKTRTGLVKSRKYGCSGHLGASEKFKSFSHLYKARSHRRCVPVFSPRKPLL